jgi:molecular chaperone DnaK
VEARNHADALVHQTDKSLKEFGDKVSEADKAAIEKAKEDLKAALEGDDADAIAAKTEALAQASMKLGEAMYNAQQAAAGATGEAPEGGHAEDVVDAEFEEVDDHKS